MTINSYNPSPTPSPSNWPTNITYIYTNNSGGQVLGYATQSGYSPGSYEKGYVPQVSGQVQSSISELPRTGLPLLGLGLSGILPGGLIFRKLSKKGKKDEETASSIWIERQFKS